MKKSVESVLAILLVIMLLLDAGGALASSYGDSIENIPRDTTITIRYELTVPANREYVQLGTRYNDEFSNLLFQSFNDWRRNRGHRRYDSYNLYHGWLFESYEDTFRNCIEQHRRYITTGGGNSSNLVENNTFIAGQGNTVINNNTIIGSPATSAQTYSYIGDNNCIPPQYTLTLLVLKPSGQERLIAEGKKLKVKSVKVRRKGIFNEVIIRLRHKTIKAIVVLTTHDPRTISIAALDSAEGGGFLGVLHGTLLGIAGNKLELEIPDPEYID